MLDFGLARAIETKEAPAETATRAGVIMGTPAYMAPEQAAGLPVDRRANIWEIDEALGFPGDLVGHADNIATPRAFSVLVKGRRRD